MKDNSYISVYLISWMRQSLTMVDMYMVMTQCPDLYNMRPVISVKIWIHKLCLGLGAFKCA